jgi:chromosome segregation ATPase
VDKTDKENEWWEAYKYDEDELNYLIPNYKIERFKNEVQELKAELAKVKEEVNFDGFKNLKCCNENIKKENNFLFGENENIKAELEKANSEITTLKDRLTYEVDMIDGACDEQIENLSKELKLANEAIEILNKIRDNLQKERREAWQELEKARELITDLSKILNLFDGFYADELKDQVNEFLKTKEGE